MALLPRSATLSLIVGLLPALVTATPVELPPMFVTQWQTLGNRQPLAFACTSTPTLLEVDGYSGIEQWSPSGMILPGYLAVVPVTTVGGWLSDVAVAPDGHIFAVGITLSSSFDRLWEFAPGSSTPLRSTELPGLPTLRSVAVLNDSTLLIAGGQPWGGTIYECSKSGSVRRQWGPTLDMELDLATMPGGDVFVSQSSTRRVWRFSSTGTPQLSWGSAGTGEGQFSGATQRIAVDVTGNVFVADKGNDRVQKFTRDGLFLCQWGGSGSPPNSLLSYPEAIAVDYFGRIFVSTGSQTTSDRLVKVFQTLATPASRQTWGAVKAQHR